MRRFSVLTVLGVLMTTAGTIGMTIGTASSSDTVAEASILDGPGYPEVGVLVDVAFQQVLVKAEDCDRASEQREAVLQADL